MGGSARLCHLSLGEGDELGTGQRGATAQAEKGRSGVHRARRDQREQQKAQQHQSQPLVGRRAYIYSRWDVLYALGQSRATRAVLAIYRVRISSAQADDCDDVRLRRSARNERPRALRGLCEGGRRGLPLLRPVRMQLQHRIISTAGDASQSREQTNT